jgi:hypothetical protein
VYQVLWSVPFCCSGFSMRAGFMRAKHLVPEAADNRDVEKVRLVSVDESHVCLDMLSLAHLCGSSGHSACLGPIQT